MSRRSLGREVLATLRLRVSTPRVRLWILAGLAAGGSVLPVSLSAEKPDVRARLIAPPAVAAASGATLVVELTVGAGWHVNGHSPAEKFLIPTDLKLTTTAGTLSPVRYPPAVEKRFSFSETPLRVYAGTVRLETDLSTPADASGTVSITGALSYQACNEQQCFAPARIPLDVSIAVSRP